MIRGHGIAGVREPSKLQSRVRLLVSAPILAIALLCGCTPSVAVRSVAPLQIVHTQYVPIPSALLQPCQAPQSTITTWGDLAQAYISLHAAYLACNAQITAIGRTVAAPAPGG